MQRLPGAVALAERVRLPDMRVGCGAVAPDTRPTGVPIVRSPGVSDRRQREYFRPVAPAVLAEAKDEWFPELLADSPYMSYAVPPRPDKAAQIREALHLDGTARVQTVHRGLHGRFYEFLCAWAKHSGIPLLINTPFNDNEPIVRSAFDAVKCFAGLPLKHLCFLDFEVMITNQTPPRSEAS